MQDFPDVPESFEEAQPYFDRIQGYGGFGQTEQNSGLRVAFLFGDVTDESAFLDVLCAPRWEGRWASRRLLKEVASIAFEQLGLRYLWAESRNSAALKAALKAGFVPTTPIHPESTVLTLTRFGYEHKYK